MLAGKQREILERHELFLEVGRAQLLEEGYEGLTIARIADATGFSKGTVYQRFGCKEELIVELGMRYREKLHSALERASEFPGRPRERMVALGEAVEYYYRQYPDEMRVLGIIDAENILEKVPEEQRSQMDELDGRIFDLMVDIVEDAIAQGDLVLAPDVTPQTLSLAIWALQDGYLVATRGSAPLDRVGITDPLKDEIVRSGHYLADGYGWRPLYGEWDYEETSRRIRAALLTEQTSVVSRI